MSVRLLSALLLTMQAVVGIAVTIVIGVFVFRVITGAPFTADWPITGASLATSYPLAGDIGAIHIDSGRLSLVSADWRPELVRAVSMFLFGIGAYLAIERLKLILAAIAAGTPFSAQVISGLRLIGWLALGWAALDVATALIMQPLMLAAATPANDTILLGGSFADPKTHVRMAFEFDFLKLAAGLFALVLAQAFAIGRTLVEDSEAIV